MRTLLLWVMLLPIPGFAQENTFVQKPERPSFTLKIAPLELINFFQQAVLLRADIPVSPRWGIDMGIGMVVNSLSLAPFKGESYRGIKVQPSIKYYIKQFDSGDNSYISLVYKYNNIYNDRYIQMSRQGGQYAEWTLQRRHRVVQGIALRFGVQQYMGQRKRWIIEPYIGLGARQMRITDDGLPPDAELLTQGRLFNLDQPPGIYNTPDFMMGIYLGWRLGAL